MLGGIHPYWKFHHIVIRNYQWNNNTYISQSILFNPVPRQNYIPLRITMSFALLRQSTHRRYNLLQLKGPRFPWQWRGGSQISCMCKGMLDVSKIYKIVWFREGLVCEWVLPRIHLLIQFLLKGKRVLILSEWKWVPERLWGQAGLIEQITLCYLVYAYS